MFENCEIWWNIVEISGTSFGKHLEKHDVLICFIGLC